MKTSNNKKTIDGYLVADFATVIALILIICSIYTLQKKYFILGGITATVAIATALLQMAKGNAQIKNYSTNCIFAKDEDSEEIIKILPNESHAGIDGINIDGKVYKIPDGTHATITSKGKVKINSLLGTFIYKIAGGELQNAPDSGWNNLFNA